MKRRHKSASSSIPKALQPGHCIFWKRQIYRVTALDPETALLISVEIIPTGEQSQLALTDLFAAPQTEEDAPLFASSLDDLYALMEFPTISLPEASSDTLPETYLFKAQMIVRVVEMVTRLVQEDEGRAQARKEAWSRTASLQRALAICNGTTIIIQIKDITQEHILHVGLSTYYKYDQLYRIYAGDTTRIAASFRRATFHLSRMSQAQLHFTDMCLLLYYGNTRSTKQRVYQLAEAILDHRTQGYWIDPDRCGKAVPEKIVTELLDPKIPMKALLDNPETKAVLTQIDMPSRAWFYGYARYVESTTDAGQQLITDRLGKAIWEQYHLVFETFVHRAQLPLQYVFADHWLVNAWIVDDETRSQPSRLWLTVLIDAYSRSMLLDSFAPRRTLY